MLSIKYEGLKREYTGQTGVKIKFYRPIQEHTPVPKYTSIPWSYKNVTNNGNK